jgi:hypothetical protein
MAVLKLITERPHYMVLVTEFSALWRHSLPTRLKDISIVVITRGNDHISSNLMY